MARRVKEDDPLIRLDRLAGKSVVEAVGSVRASRSLEPEVKEIVAGIIEDVRRRGDEALIDYTERFDGFRLSRGDLRVGEEEFQQAYSGVSEREFSALKAVKEKLERVEGEVLNRLSWSFSDNDGVEVRLRTRPLKSVGCYVPGGRASYPSSLLMTCVPALKAGVPRIVVCSPPSGSKVLNPLLLVAADMCGVKEMYRVGGAQAIAALAYGTETIRPVQKIFGPGNVYVTEAKLMVSDRLSIDLPAGPTELLIVADDAADPLNVARDLIAQAEHGEESICGLLTDSGRLASQVVKALEALLPAVSRSEVVSKALSSRGFIYICDDMEQALDFVNLFAPEHLELMTSDADELAGRVESAGLILLGSYSPAAASDYCVGTNHVLPTGGYAAMYSGLSVLDYVKRVYEVRCMRSGLEMLMEVVEALSEAEGLRNHWLSVKERFKS